MALPDLLPCGSRMRAGLGPRLYMPGRAGAGQGARCTQVGRLLMAGAAAWSSDWLHTMPCWRCVLLQTLTVDGGSADCADQTCPQVQQLVVQGQPRQMGASHSYLEHDRHADTASKKPGAGSCCQCDRVNVCRGDPQVTDKGASIAINYVHMHKYSTKGHSTSSRLSTEWYVQDARGCSCGLLNKCAHHVYNSVVDIHCSVMQQCGTVCIPLTANPTHL
jgi:hypothetical protein